MGFTGGQILKTFDIDGDRFPDVGFTVYSGSTTATGAFIPLFGNIVSITSGPCNTIYAAVARSFVPTDDPATQATEGLFPSSSALGPTPSMIISFADCSGDFDACTGINLGPAGRTRPGNAPGS